jgi:hypothetical protein
MPPFTPALLQSIVLLLSMMVAEATTGGVAISNAIRTKKMFFRI